MIKYSQYNTIIKIVVFIIVGLALLALVGSLRIGLARSFSIVFGGMLILIIPGLSATLIFFPGHDTLFSYKKEEGGGSRTLDMVERVTLGGILSIILSSGVVFGLYNIAGIDKLNFHNLIWAIIFLNMFVGAIAFWKQKWSTFAQAIPIVVLPSLIYLFNKGTGVAFTNRNIILEILVFIGIIIIIIGLVKFVKKYFA